MDLDKSNFDAWAALLSAVEVEVRIVSVREHECVE